MCDTEQTRNASAKRCAAESSRGGHPACLRQFVTPMPDATSQLRVLVIDDSVDNAEALCALLAVMGCLTAVAFSGTDGVAAAPRFDPHLAFIDLEMPGMGGAMWLGTCARAGRRSTRDSSV